MNLKIPIRYFSLNLLEDTPGGLLVSILTPAAHRGSLAHTLRTFLHCIIGLQQPDKVNAARKFHSELQMTERRGIQEYFHAKLDLKNTNLWKLERSTDNRVLLMQGSAFVGESGFVPFYRTKPNEMEVHCR